MGKIPIRFFGGVKFIEPTWQNDAIAIHPTMRLGGQGIISTKDDGLYAVTSKKTGQQIVTAETMDSAKEFAEKWGETIGRIIDDMSLLDKDVANNVCEIAGLAVSLEAETEGA